MALSAKAIVESSAYAQLNRPKPAAADSRSGSSHQVERALPLRVERRRNAGAGAHAPLSSLAIVSLDCKDARQDARAEARCRHPSVRRPEVAGYRCDLPGLSR